MELTTIQLEKSTLQKLKEFKEYARETYDEIVNKLMKYKEMTEPQLTEETIRDIDESRKEKSIPLSESIKRLGVKIDLWNHHQTKGRKTTQPTTQKNFWKNIKKNNIHKRHTTNIYEKIKIKKHMELRNWGLQSINRPHWRQKKNGHY